MRKRPSLLMCLAGVGLGNATRCLAIAEALEGVDIAVISFGRGARFFKERGYPVHNLFELILPKRKRDYVWLTPINLFLFFMNSFRSLYYLWRTDADVLLLDSEYSAILPGLLLRKRLIGLNQAPAVKALWPRFGDSTLAFSYWTREVGDALLCKLFHRTLVPTFTRDIALPKHCLPISPIVRKLPKETVPQTETPLILRGGSDHFSPLEHSVVLAMDEIGGPQYVADSLERIAAAPLVICQGGFSSLSEVVALRKKAIAFPLPGHAEQTINVRVLSSMHRVMELNGEKPLVQALEEARTFVPNLEGFSFDGALEAATALRGWGQPEVWKAPSATGKTV